MIHILAGQIPTGDYAQPTPAAVTFWAIAIPVIIGVCLLINFGARQERKHQNRQGRR